MFPALAWLPALLLSLLPGPGPWFRTGKLLYSDGFSHGLSRWSAELERPGLMQAKNGILTLDAPAGATVWFRPELSGPVLIEYEATMIRETDRMTV